MSKLISYAIDKACQTPYKKGQQRHYAVMKDQNKDELFYVLAERNNEQDSTESD